MAELAEELARKSAAIDSLERAVENAHYEIRMLNDLLKIGEQEKDRKIAALDEVRLFLLLQDKSVTMRSEDPRAGGASGDRQPWHGSGNRRTDEGRRR